MTASQFARKPHSTYPSRPLLALSLLLTLLALPAFAAGPPAYQHVDLSAAKALMLTQLNEVRAGRGLPLLQEEPAVSLVAAAHARDMVARDYFAHFTPEGTGPQERLAAAGLPYPVGENLGALRSYGISPSDIVTGLLQSLLESPAHRANLLDPRATHVGIGFCQDKDNQSAFMDLDLEGNAGAGTVVVCQEFIRKPLRDWAPSTAPGSVRPREAVLLSGTPVDDFAAVALEIIDRDTQKLVRYDHVPLVDGEFHTQVKLDEPGRYEVRVLGLQPGMLVQRPEPLGTFLVTVEGKIRRKVVGESQPSGFEGAVF